MSHRRNLLLAAVVGTLAATANSSASAQGITVTRLRLLTGHPVSSVVLAGTESIQKELGLNSDQAGKANALMLEHRGEFLSEFQSSGLDFGGLANATEEERAKKLAEFQQKVGEIGKSMRDKFAPKLAAILETPQRERLAELERQAAGAHLLADAEVVKSLELSKDQQERLAKLDKEFAGKVVKFFGTDGDREERAAQFQQLGTDWDAQALDVLNKEQKEKLAKLKGKTFDFSDLRIGGG